MHIPVQVYSLNSLKHLLCEIERKAKLQLAARAKHEGIERGAKKINYEVIEVLLCAEFDEMGDAEVCNWIFRLNFPHDACFSGYFWVADWPLLDLDGNCSSIFKMQCLKDLVEGTDA